MYTGSDLTDIQDALEVLCSDGFLTYDFNVGKLLPWLNITVSQSQVALYPWLNSQNYSYLLNIYFTIDFSIPAADFIQAFQDGVAASILNNSSAVGDLNTRCQDFSNFETAYLSKG